MLATSCSCSHYVQLISITIGLGMNRLRSADAVVYDRLSIPTLPLDLPDTVELYPVGKEAGNHPVPQ